MVNTRHRRHRPAVDDSWQRELQVFVFSVIIGLSLGALAVFFFGVLPERERVALLEARLAETELQIKLEKTAPPPQAITPTPTPTQAPPAAPVAEAATASEEEATAPTGQLPIPRRPPARPAGDIPKVSLIGAAKLTETVTLLLKVGEEKEAVNGLRLRLSAISKRRAGNFCVVSGSSLPASGLRVSHNGSSKFNWNGQRLIMAAAMTDKQSCRLTVRPSS